MRQLWAAGNASAPERPSPAYERRAKWLLSALAPSLSSLVPAKPNPRLHPFEGVLIERRHSGAGGFLSGYWFAAPGKARGAVLMAHPWVRWGQGFLHRRGRIETLRQNGYHVLTFDFGGFGHSGPQAACFADRDVEDALAFLQARVGALPCHLWAVSAGGCWSHGLLSRVDGVSGVVFEDVAQSLLAWSRRTAPVGMPFYLFFQHVLPKAYRFLDQRCHASLLRVREVTYIGCENDRGAPIDETRKLADLAGARFLKVSGADHLGALKVAPQQVFDAVLDTFARAEA